MPVVPIRVLACNLDPLPCSLCRETGDTWCSGFKFQCRTLTALGTARMTPARVGRVANRESRGAQNAESCRAARRSLNTGVAIFSK